MRIKKIMCKKHGTDPPDREGNKESLVAMILWEHDGMKRNQERPYY